MDELRGILESGRNIKVVNNCNSSYIGGQLQQESHILRTLYQ